MYPTLNQSFIYQIGIGGSKSHRYVNMMLEMTLLHNVYQQKIFVNCSMLKNIRRDKLSLFMRKHALCIHENRGADQLRGNRAADQRLFSLHTLLIP